MLWFSLFWACAPKSSPESDPEPTVVEEVGEMPWVNPEEWGPFTITADTLEWVDERGKEMVAEVWYPAMDEEGAEARPYAPLTLSAHALRHVDPDDRFAPYPLIAFSHGFAGIRFQSIFLVEFLASHGFVVVSPDHEHNTFLDMNDDHLVQVILERPGDVVSAVDEVFRRSADEEDDLNGMVTPGDYAMVGHSFGAFTTLIVGGGQVDIVGAQARCDNHGARLCSEVRQITNEDVQAHAMEDDRAVVTVPMSPGIWYAFGADGESAPGLESLRTPLVLAGDLDEVLRYETEERPAYGAMGSPKVLATFHGAGHYGFSDICALAPFLSDECSGSNDGWMDVAEVQRISRTITLSHIRKHLLGESRDEPWQAENWLIEEAMVTVESE